MPDVSHIINRIFAHLLCHLKRQQGVDDNFCFFPSSIYVGLLSLLPHMGWPKHFLDFLGSDVPAILDDEDELQYFLSSIPKLVTKEHDLTAEASIKMFLHQKESSPKAVHHKLLELFALEREVVKDGDMGVLANLIHEWSRSRLNIRDLRQLKCGAFHKHSSSICIVNTLHFSACWRTPFDPSQTRTKQFHVNPQLTVQVETMHLRQVLRCCVHKELDLSMIELPFQNPRYSTLLLHPLHKTGCIWSLKKRINALLIEDCISLFEYSEVSLALPRLKFNAHHSILPLLSDENLFGSEKNDDGAHKLTEFTQAISMLLNEHGLSSKVSPRPSLATEGERNVAHASIHKLNRPFILVIYDGHHRCPILVVVVTYPIRK